MNRRAFIRSLAVTGAAVAIAPHLAFTEEETANGNKYVIVQILWPQTKSVSTPVGGLYLLKKTVEEGEVDRSESIGLGSTTDAEFLGFKPSTFRDVVEPMLKEDKVKYIAHY